MTEQEKTPTLETEQGENLERDIAPGIVEISRDELSLLDSVDFHDEAMQNFLTLHNLEPNSLYEFHITEPDGEVTLAILSTDEHDHLTRDREATTKFLETNTEAESAEVLLDSQDAIEDLGHQAVEGVVELTIEQEEESREESQPENDTTIEDARPGLLASVGRIEEAIQTIDRNVGTFRNLDAVKATMDRLVANVENGDYNNDMAVKTLDNISNEIMPIYARLRQLGSQDSVESIKRPVEMLQSDLNQLMSDTEDQDGKLAIESMTEPLQDIISKPEAVVRQMEEYGREFTELIRQIDELKFTARMSLDQTSQELRLVSAKLGELLENISSVRLSNNLGEQLNTVRQTISRMN